MPRGLKMAFSRSQDIVTKRLVGINTDSAAVDMGKKTEALQQIIDEIKQFHYSVDFIFLSFGIMGFVVEL